MFHSVILFSQAPGPVLYRASCFSQRDLPLAASACLTKSVTVSLESNSPLPEDDGPTTGFHQCCSNFCHPSLKDFSILACSNCFLLLPTFRFRPLVALSTRSRGSHAYYPPVPPTISLVALNISSRSFAITPAP